MFARLREQLEERGDFAGLIRLYAQRAGAVGGEEALYLQLTIAEVWGARMGDPEVVAGAYQEALRMSVSLGSAGPAQVRDALKEVFWARGDWRSLSDLTEAEARQMPPGPERARIWVELAQLRLDKLGEVSLAAVAYMSASREPQAPIMQIRQELESMLQRNPNHQGVFDALRKICEAHLAGPQDAQYLLNLLERRLEQLNELNEPDARLELLIQMGRLTAQHLGDVDRGLEVVRQAHRAGAEPDELVPILEALLNHGEDVDVLGLLRTLLRGLARWNDLVQVGQREAAVTQEPRDRAAILMEVALVYDERLNNLDQAAALYGNAVSLDESLADTVVERLEDILAHDPEHAGSLEALGQIHRARGDDQALLELLEAQEARTRDQRRRANILVEMAVICAGSYGRPDRALECYEAAADLAGDDVSQIIEGLFGLYHQGYYTEQVERILRQVCVRAERWNPLVSLLELLIDDASDVRHQAALHFEMGQVLEQRLELLEQAMQHYQRAFRLDTSMSHYIEAGRVLYRRIGNMEMVARLYDIQLKVAEGPDQAAALLLEKSRVLANEVGDPARAMEALGRASALAPDFKPAREALEAQLRSPEGFAALRRLESAYLEAGRPAEAASIYLMAAEQLHQRLASIAEGDPERPELMRLAIDCDLRAYEIDPTGNARVRATARLEAGLADSGRWTELVELLERRASEEPDPERRVDLLLELGGVAWERLTSLELAAAAWQAVLDQDPANLRAYTSLEGIFTTSDAQDSLDELLCWALDKAPWASIAEDPRRRAALFVRLAQQRQNRGAESEAYRAWLLLGELDPNHADARAYFEARADTPEGAQDLFRLLERGLSSLTDIEARTERLELLARLAAERMEDPLLAIDQHRAIMGLHGVDMQARREAFGRLQDLYRDIEQVDALVDLLEGELGRSDAGDTTRVGLLVELVQIHAQERHDLPAAIESQRRLVNETPEDPAARLLLAQLCQRQGDAGQQAEVLRELLAMAQEDGGWERLASLEDGTVFLKPADLRLRLARLEARELEQPAEAINTYKRLLQGEHLRQEALDELQQVLFARQDFEGLMEVLEAEAERARDTSDKVHFLSRMAMLAEQELGDLERAVALWLRVLEVRPKDPDALQTLEQLYSQLGRWEQLIAVCRARLGISPDADARARLLRKIGRVWRQHDRLEEAAGVYHELLEELPEDLLARQALYEIHSVREDHTAQVAVIGELLRFESDSARRHELMLKETEVRLEHLDDVDGAINTLERLVEDHPMDTSSLEQLHNLLLEEQRWPRAAAVLDKLAAQTSDIARRIDRLLELSSLQEERLGAPEVAADVLEQVLTLHPANRDALQRLERLYDEPLERPEALVNVRARLVELVTDPAQQVALLRSLALVLEERLEQPAAAFARVAQAHEVAPDDGQHLEELYRLAEKASLWPHLLQVLSADASRSPTIEARHDIQRRMAELIEVRLGDPRTAFGIHREIFLDAPRQGQELQELERLAQDEPALWQRVVELYGKLIEQTVEAEPLAELHWKVAELQRRGLENPPEAFGTLRAALSIETQAEQTLVRLRTLAEEEGLWQELVSLGEERWRGLEGRDAQIDVLLDNARLIEAHLEDPERALEQYVLAFQLDPRRLEIEERLRELAVAEQTVRDLVLKLYEVVIKECRSENDVEGQIHFLTRMTELHDARQEHEEAFASMMRAFKIEPRHEDVQRRLEALGEQVKRLGEVAEAYQNEAEQSRRDQAMPFYLASARLLSGPLELDAHAIDLLRRALEVSPDDSDVLAQLEVLYRNRDDLESLVGLYIHRAERTVDREGRYDAYLAVAALLEQSADPERAVEYHRRALRLNPRNIEVLERLAALYERLEQPDRKARILEQIVEILDSQDDGERLIPILDQLAVLYANNRRPTRSVEMIQRLLDLRPLRQSFFERLESTLEESNKLDALMDTYQERVKLFDDLMPELEAIEHGQEVPARLLNDDGEQSNTGDLRREQLRILRLMVDMSLDGLKTPRRGVKLLNDLLGRFPDDVEAIERLAELYAGLERWQDHISTLRRSMDFLSPEGKALTLRRISEVYEERLYHPGHAAEVLEELVALTDEDAPTFTDLGRLCIRLERWDDALGWYRKAVALEPPNALSDDLQADIWCQIAEVEERYKRNDDAAFEAYEHALKLHPNNPRARQAVIRYLAVGDQWERQISLLRLEVDQTNEAARRAELLWEIGGIFRDRGQDPAAAVEAYREALFIDGQMLVALRDLADAAFHAGLWYEAAETYGVLVGGTFTRIVVESQPLDPSRLGVYESSDEPAFVTYTVRLGYAMEALGRHDEAIEHYVQALRIRSTNIRALMGAGRLLFNMGNRDAAARHLRKLMATHLENMQDAEIAHASFMLGSIHHSNNQSDKALDFLELTLERDPSHRVAAQLSYEIATALQREEQAAAALSRVIDLTEDKDVRRSLLVKLGDLYGDRLSDPAMALTAYEKILEDFPGDLLAAERGLGIHIKQERWERALEISGQLIEQDQLALADHPERAEDRRWVRGAVRHLLRHGHILYNGHGRASEALGVYERALELDPTNLDALGQIGLMLGARGDFEALIERYDGFVSSLADNNVSLRIEVLRRLGSLLHEELQAHDRALGVYQELRELAPRDFRVHDALYRLYLTPSQHDPESALDALRTLIMLGEVTQERFRQLLALYRETDRHDGAAQILRLLDFCRCTSREEQQQVRDHRDDLSDLRSGDLNADAYHEHILPPLGRGPLASLLTFVYRKARGVLYQSLTDLGVDESDRISGRRNLNVANIFRDVAEILGQSEVELYLRRDEVRGIQMALSNPPSVVIGEDIFRGLFNREQRFVLGRALEMSRSAFITVAALPPFEFMAFYEAVFALAVEPQERAWRVDERLQERIEFWLESLEEVMDEVDKVSLAALVEACQEVFGDKRPTVVDWRYTARASAQRTGLFLCGEPLVALKRLLREEERLRSPSIRSFEDLIVAMETSRDIREVVLYLLSEDFILARRKLKGEPLPQRSVIETPKAVLLPSAEEAVEVTDDELLEFELDDEAAIEEAEASVAPMGDAMELEEADLTTELVVGKEEIAPPPAPPVSPGEVGADEPGEEVVAEAIEAVEAVEVAEAVEASPQDEDGQPVLVAEEGLGADDSPAQEAAVSVDAAEAVVDAQEGALSDDDIAAPAPDAQPEASAGLDDDVAPPPPPLAQATQEAPAAAQDEVQAQEGHGAEVSEPPPAPAEMPLSLYDEDPTSLALLTSEGVPLEELPSEVSVSMDESASDLAQPSSDDEAVEVDASEVVEVVDVDDIEAVIDDGDELSGDVPPAPPAPPAAPPAAPVPSDAEGQEGDASELPPPAPPASGEFQQPAPLPEPDEAPGHELIGEGPNSIEFFDPMDEDDEADDEDDEGLLLGGFDDSPKKDSSETTP